MSYAEIWDDSALVDSWNEALEEYKHYHSIHARGEKVEDVLRANERQKDVTSGEVNYEGLADEQTYEDQHAKEDLHEETVDHAKFTQEGTRVENEDDQSTAKDSQASRTPALPQHLIGQVHDESIKNLLMAWYYAGYYQGRYDEKMEAALPNNGKLQTKHKG